MKCRHCGIEVSDKVLKLHESRCSMAENTGIESKSLEELKQIADEKGVKYSPNIGKTKLLEKLSQVEG